MAAELYVPHIGTYHDDMKITYIVQMRVPLRSNGGHPYVALSDYTTEKHQARVWLLAQRARAGEYLRERAREDA